MVPCCCQSTSPGKWSLTNSSEHLCEDSKSMKSSGFTFWLQFLLFLGLGPRNFISLSLSFLICSMWRMISQFSSLGSWENGME